MGPDLVHSRVRAEDASVPRMALDMVLLTRQEVSAAVLSILFSITPECLQKHILGH